MDLNIIIAFCSLLLDDSLGHFNKREVSVYSHLFCQSISQNSEVVAVVVRHTLQEEKARHPEINETFYRSDCAGSYASG